MPRTLRSASILLVGLVAAGSPIMAATTAAPIKPQVSYGSAMHKETVDERIAALHAALQITPSEEAAWSNVASVMQRNDAAMQRLAADRKAQASTHLTAIDDLETYEAFNQAHLDGLKDLITAFQALYASMPDAQKANADHVMVRFGHAPMTSHTKHSARSAT
jgi:hypothetical protein